MAELTRMQIMIDVVCAIISNQTYSDLTQEDIIEQADLMAGKIIDKIDSYANAEDIDYIDRMMAAKENGLIEEQEEIKEEIEEPEELGENYPLPKRNRRIA